MAKPIVAIVGRPNVGKSTFFNYIVGRRVSIVEGTPGVTRDRIYAEAEWRGSSFVVIDTGGIEMETDDVILSKMKEQTELAIDTADVIIFVVDIKDGITNSDTNVANMLRMTDKPVIVAVNKVDQIGESPPEFYEFYNLGLDEIFPISSVHGLGIGDILDGVYNCLETKHLLNQEEDDSIKVAVVGKPNVGKSSLINKILGEQRVIVNDLPGTTRDAIDTYFEKDDQSYVLIDTAGLRRKSKINDKIEKYSTIRSRAAIERADVCLIMIDANEGVTEQDTKIAGYVHESGKASMVIVNKWDQLQDKKTNTIEEYKKNVYEKLGFMTYSPTISISAKTGQRVDKIFGIVNRINKNSLISISTGVLNDFINEVTAIVQPPSDKGKRLKIYYATQCSIKPPTFILFVNNFELMHYSYERYLENQIRKSFGLEGTPIRFIIREKKKEGNMD